MRLLNSDELHYTHGQNLPQSRWLTLKVTSAMNLVVLLLCLVAGAYGAARGDQTAYQKRTGKPQHSLQIISHSSLTPTFPSHWQVRNILQKRQLKRESLHSRAACSSRSWYQGRELLPNRPEFVFVTSVHFDASCH